MRKQYDESEWQVVGFYPVAQAMLAPGAVIKEDGKLPPLPPPTPKFARPISPLENFQMFFRNETPYWIPEVGWFNCDLVQFRPRQHPDNLANRQCFDGGEPIDWRKVPLVVEGWLGLPLEFEPHSSGAIVRPGTPMLTELYGWKDKVRFPDLDKEIDWAEVGRMNSEYCYTDKPTQLGIQLGLWERMMNLMDVTNAAVALMDPDQEQEVKSFLDALADLYIDYIGRLIKVCRIDAIHFHDDWGTQRGPFFSLETAMEFFVPPMKKIVDFCHSNNIIFEHHCCGSAGKLVPAMIETGSDFWNPQSYINDIDALIDEYQGRYTFAAHSPLLRHGTSEETVREMAKAFVDKYKDKHVVFIQDSALRTNREYDGSLYPIFKKYIYEFSRRAYS